VTLRSLLPDQLLSAACVAVLCGTLWAGLWPFHSPPNGVTWLQGENGLRFDNAGTILSDGELGLGVPSDSGCSIEVWVQPALRWVRRSTLLAFYMARTGGGFQLRQSLLGLTLQRENEATLSIDNVFRAMPPKPVFITVSSGANDTAVYLDGVLARSSPQFRITALDCTGQLVFGTTPLNSNNWTGVLRGLAIYHSGLTPRQVARHYETWTRVGLPELDGEERAVAVYGFEEHGGNRIQNRIASGVDLVIPERYMIQDQAFLMPFWEEFKTFGWSWNSILINIAGLVPLGFLFYAWFRRKTTPQRAAWATTILGTTVSLTIEVLQADLPTRYSGTTDIFTNALGTWLGVVLYRYVNRYLAEAVNVLEVRRLTTYFHRKDP